MCAGTTGSDAVDRIPGSKPCDSSKRVIVKVGETQRCRARWRIGSPRAKCDLVAIPQNVNMTARSSRDVGVVDKYTAAIVDVAD
jgi:hypothetical protein